MSWISEHLAPLMFGGMVLFMLVGYPAAFSLAATGLFFGFLGIEFGLIRPDFLGNLTFQLFGIISNDLLLAIPFFTFMGAILERCGWPRTCSIPSGNCSGRCAADVLCGDFSSRHSRRDHRHGRRFGIAMGVISMTPMLKYGYSTATPWASSQLRHHHATHPAVAVLVVLPTNSAAR
jgi:TRAP-type mannitol/chloroaromatic compound transport system permease large subunit